MNNKKKKKKMCAFSYLYAIAIAGGICLKLIHPTQANQKHMRWPLHAGTDNYYNKLVLALFMIGCRMSVIHNGLEH